MLIDKGAVNSVTIELTKRKILILKAIKRFSQDHGYQPTNREVMKAVSLQSSSTIHKHLSRLKGAGYVDFVEGQPRTLRLTEKGIQAIENHN